MPTTAETTSRQRLINAPAARIFAVLTDLEQHPAIDGAGMLTGRPEGPNPLTLGAQFSMGMRARGLGYRTTNTVTEFEPDRRIAWCTASDWRGRRVIGGQVWRWELEPRTDDTTLVRHSYDWSHMKLKALMVGLLRFPDKTGPAMERSLANLAGLV